MTATDELRRMLDERGVEYEKADGWWTSWETEGVYSYGGTVYCEDLGSGLEIRWHTITPEQAIAATLDAGTCHVEGSYYEDLLDEVFTQLSCGHEVFGLTEFDYCPYCGREVEG